MTERPIIFSGPMVRAILDGQKTVTRRIVKPQPDELLRPMRAIITGDEWWCCDAPAEEQLPSMGTLEYDDGSTSDMAVKKVRSWKCPYGQTGDRLYVKERYWLVDSRAFPDWPQVLYADEIDKYQQDGWQESQPTAFWYSRLWSGAEERWGPKPSIHMPRAHSRITLEICDVRVERLNSINFADIRKEGVDCPEHDFPGGFCCSECPSLRKAFRDLWASIHGDKHPWQANEYVWRIAFRKLTP
jgi:hypothetical protein